MAKVLLVNPVTKRARKGAKKGQATMKGETKGGAAGASNKGKGKGKGKGCAGRSTTVLETIRRKVKTKRNPAPFALGDIAVSSGIGSVGAVGIRAAFSFLPIPPQMVAGEAGNLLRAFSGVALGYALSKVVKGRIGPDVARGAVTVELAELIENSLLPKVMNGLGLGGLGAEPQLYYDEASGLFQDSEGNVYVGEGDGVDGLGFGGMGEGFLEPAPVGFGEGFEFVEQ